MKWMRGGWLMVGLAAASVLLAGCEQTQAQSGDKPAQVVPIQGSSLSRIVLTQQAADRLGLKTAPVERLAAPGAGGATTAVPLAALVYDRDGSTWVYTVSAPLTYVRQAVTVAAITGETAVLGAGPAPGVAVVTVGAAELLGSEYGVAGE